jgi:ATP-dependent RNA helicase DeaD
MADTPTNNISFDTLNLPEFLSTKLEHMGYTKPTDIQAQAIPVVLEGKDILASSQTGSGKTAAFVIPIITKIFNHDAHSALILVPTRELALQISDVVNLMRGTAKINTALLFGGTPMDKQIMALKKQPKIIIATPGRLQDHIKRRNVDISTFNILVLDEFDRMLDMGFRDDIAAISRHLPKQRQTLMFSATKRASVIAQAKTYLHNFVEISITPPKDTHQSIEQSFLDVRYEEKYAELLKIITGKEGSMIVFTNMKRTADDVAYQLQQDGIEAQAIHGDLRQRQRENVIRRFKEGKLRIVVATDVAARGIDVPNIQYVINYDIPTTFEDYTHRIGRTGRAGAKGFSICFVTRGEKHLHENIIRKIDADTTDQQFQRRKPQARRPFGGGERSFGGGNRSGGGYGGERKFDRNNSDRPDRNNSDRGATGERRYGSERSSESRDSRPARRYGESSDKRFGDRKEFSPSRKFDGNKKNYGNRDE